MQRSLLLVAPALLVFASFAQAQTSPDVTTLPGAQAVIDGWYRQFLGRAPDLGSAGWVLALVSGQSPVDILADILSSQEFFTRAGGTNAGFVALLFQDLIGRAPMPLELIFWTDVLIKHSRKDVAIKILTAYGQGTL